MKLLIASSIKYRESWDDLEKRLTNLGFDVIRTDEAKGSSRDEIIKSFLKLMDSVEGLYVYAPDGEVGGSVASEIGYAYAKGKKVYSSSILNDDGLKYYISEVL